MLEIKRSENSQNAKPRNVMREKHMVMAHSCMGQWEGAAQKAGAPELSTKKELCGLEVQN
jgi:hypothetical protein